MKRKVNKTSPKSRAPMRQSQVEAVSPFLQTLLSGPGPDFDRPVEDICAGRSMDLLLADCNDLEQFWSHTDNLYLRVRALIFLFYLHRFVLPERIRQGERPQGLEADVTLQPMPIPYAAHRLLQDRQYPEAIMRLLQLGVQARLNETLSSGLAQAYHSLALQNLANQVRVSVRQEIGNQWMFRIGHPDDYPLAVVKPLLHGKDGTVPGSGWLIEETPVRMDLSHSCWSDIFFLGMDRPEFAKVINASVDLTITDRNRPPVPPCLSAIRVIDRPVIRLVSLDLECATEVTDLSALFDFGRDYLGLLKAAVIASGMVPSGMEGSTTSLTRLLGRLVGPGNGIELVSWVRDIPKGSRLAVSTNLLGGLIAVCMRATGQIANLSGPLTETDRRLVASRAILGEWLGGSGGGWQDSGGVWPGVKLIEGCTTDGGIAEPMAPSRDQHHSMPGNDALPSAARGALLPRHTRLDGDYAPETSVRALEDSLILIHGGMAANVGPILEMVTERYLLRSQKEWQARKESLGMTDAILQALRAGDIRTLGRLTTEHFFGPLKAVIPWASNAFTERLIHETSAALTQAFGPAAAGETANGETAALLNDCFWGFWMLGGMSGGGMGLIVHPEIKERAKPVIAGVLQRLKEEYEHSLPFAMNPVIYDFKLNRTGSCAVSAAATPDAVVVEAYLREYHRFQLPMLLQKPPAARSRLDLGDLAHIRGKVAVYGEEMLTCLLPEATAPAAPTATQQDRSLDGYLQRYGFDPQQHESIREDLLAGRVGLSQNRLHPKTPIDDVRPEDIARRFAAAACRRAGKKALAEGQCAVVTLAAGAGSRWTQGAGVVKALHPFAPLAGAFRRFIEIHLAKTGFVARQFDQRLPLVVTTSYLTHEPIAAWRRLWQAEAAASGADSRVDMRLSEGRSVGLRFTPTLRDLRYAWYELPGERLDDQAEKMRESVRQALMRWAATVGEASDYRDNLPLQCLHPVGHWYELPNLFLNGTLESLLQGYPNLRYLLLHNIDTLGASLDPELLGHHILSGRVLSYEVIQRCFDDVGGGLARVNGRLRLVEGFALPREEDEFNLSFYNTLTTWIDLDQLLAVFGLQRHDFVAVADPYAESLRRDKIQAAVRRIAAQMPTYLTLKESKKRWGRGQEDVYPILQFERLWGDMTAFLERSGDNQVDFLHVSRQRGRQLKDPAQLDLWAREGSLQALEHFVR